VLSAGMAAGQRHQQPTYRQAGRTIGKFFLLHCRVFQLYSFIIDPAISGKSRLT
jgi:hypothetical protein